jgi:hypothetical protein
VTRLPPRVVNNYTFNGDGHANDILLSGKKPRRRKRPDKAKKKEGKEKRRKTREGNQQGVKDANTSSNRAIVYIIYVYLKCIFTFCFVPRPLPPVQLTFRDLDERRVQFIPQKSAAVPPDDDHH